MKPLKEARLALRFPTSLKDKLDQIEAETGIPPTILAVEGLVAICKYYDSRNSLLMPFIIIPKPGRDAAPTCGKTGAKKSQPSAPH